MPKEKKRRRPYGYWNDEVNVEKELLAWIEKYNHFPSQKDLGKTGNSGLCTAIAQHGGLGVWCIRLGFSANRKSMGYWDDETNVEKELRAWIEEHGHFPTHTNLKETNLSGLGFAIKKHGGIDIWRERMNFLSDSKPIGYWKDEANVEKELRAWIEEYGHFPTNDDLKNSSNSSLGVAISNHGGFNFWRDRLGFLVNKRPDGYWDNETTIEKELLMWIEEHGHFPSGGELEKTGNSSLKTAISRHGGLLAWRTRLQFPSESKPHGYWNDETNIEQELRAWIEEHGHFPTTENLKETNDSSLAAAIFRHGGIYTWSVRLGSSPVRKPSGFWDDEVNVEKNLRLWIKEYGHFPTQAELMKTKNSSLSAAIRKHGGFSVWRTRLGYNLVNSAMLKLYIESLTAHYLSLPENQRGTFAEFLEQVLQQCPTEKALKRFLERIPPVESV